MARPVRPKVPTVMSEWSLSTILATLHEDIQHRLRSVRATIGRPGSKGDGSENVWLDLLGTYLPERYRVAKAFVVDSEGNFSQQIDVVVFDRQYTPFIFKIEGQIVVPAESVYAVFEAKQTLDAALIAYAQEKVASVRKLQRTSLPIPHAGGTYPPKPPTRILGGILSFESEWSPPLGDALERALMANLEDGVLDIGCVASHGHLFRAGDSFQLVTAQKPATSFLFKLIAMLQFSGTVPMIDIEAYGRWLTE